MADILRYYLDPRKQLELVEFTEALIALEKEYSDFSRRRGVQKAEAKLYVEKISEGSVIVDLIENVSQTLIPGIVDAVAIGDFALHLRNLYLYFMRKTSDRPEGITITQCENVSKIVAPLVNDPQGEISISVVNNGVIGDITIQVNATDANAVQHTAKEEAKVLKATQNSLQTYVRTLLTVTQLNANKKADLGVVEEISNSELRLLLKEEDKEFFVEGVHNPLKTTYYVDVTPISKGNKLYAYRVERVHDVFKD